ncbi:MAG: winged helix-turn-helix transcriptional regulator [Lachnospiraceae bacterium]|nr:winged helix-turn-helix transcriptional regulator [Lachnospiraceae bacterium]
MEKQFFVGKVDYLAEAMRLLSHMGSGETYGEFKKELSRKYNVGTVAFEEKFQLLIDIEKDALKCLRGKEDLVQEYFGSSQQDGEGRGLAILVILWEDSAPWNYMSLEELKKELETISEEEYCKRYSMALRCYESRIQDEWGQKACENPMDVIRFLMDMDLPEGEKWKLQTIFLKPGTHREKVFELLENVIVVLQKYSEELERLAEAFAVYWEQKLVGRDMAEFINERIGFSLEDNPLGFCMRPGIFSPSAISMYAKAEEDEQLSTPYVFTVGILFDDDFLISVTGADIKEKQEYNLKVLKMLSDSSKFEILSYIKDKSAYGSQLAKHLGLTTATISHHMSALLSVGLVTMETKESKVYYKGNAKAIAEVLDYCKQVLAQ